MGVGKKRQVVCFTVQVPIQVTPKNNWYVAGCPVLDIYSQGRTYVEAQKNLREAIQLFLGHCFEAGTLDQVLKASGFTPIHDEADATLSGTGDTLDVPIPFWLRGNAEAQAC